MAATSDNGRRVNVHDVPSGDETMMFWARNLGAATIESTTGERHTGPTAGAGPSALARLLPRQF